MLNTRRSVVTKLAIGAGVAAALILLLSQKNKLKKSKVNSHVL